MCDKKKVLVLIFKFLSAGSNEWQIQERRTQSGDKQGYGSAVNGHILCSWL